MKLSVNQDAFLPGCPISIRYQIQNRAQVEVESVIFTLLETVEWTARQRKEVRHERSTSTDFSAHRLNTGKREISLEEGLAEIVVPAAFRASYDGDLIQRRHYVQLKLDTCYPWWSPKMRLPITLYEPEHVIAEAKELGGVDVVTTSSSAKKVQFGPGPDDDLKRKATWGTVGSASIHKRNHVRGVLEL